MDEKAKLEEKTSEDGKEEEKKRVGEGREEGTPGGLILVHKLLIISILFVYVVSIFLFSDASERYKTSHAT